MNSPTNGHAGIDINVLSSAAGQAYLLAWLHASIIRIEKDDLSFVKSGLYLREG